MQAQVISSLLLKKIEIGFEPAKVILLSEGAGASLLGRDLPFKVLKDQSDLLNHKYLIVTVASISSDTKPMAILIAASAQKVDKVEALSVLVEDSDFVESGLISLSKDRILELRSEFVALNKSIKSAQSQLGALKARAASLARLNRLVEAQTTVVSLKQKLEGLLSDKANLSMLLDIVRQEQPSARLASSEAALSRDLRLLSQEGAGVNKQKGPQLNEAQRVAAQKIIDKAAGLDIETLRRKVKVHRNQHNQLDHYDDLEAKDLADEYNRKHNQGGVANLDANIY